MRRDRYEIRGKTVVITGPARGVGAETARQLAARGAKLGLVGIEPERLESLAAELGDGCVWFEADVRERAQLDTAVTGVVDRFGAIDVVIANAGIADVGEAWALEEARFRRVVDVNLFGAWNTVCATIDEVSRQGGYMLPVASLVASIHFPWLSCYQASKAAVEAFANGLRVEVADRGVDVGVAYFSFVDTDLAREGAEAAQEIEGADSLLKVMRSPVVKMLSAQEAASALVRGIERRSRRVVVPRYYLPLQLAPGLAQPVADAYFRWVLRRRHGQAAWSREAGPAREAVGAQGLAPTD